MKENNNEFKFINKSEYKEVTFRFLNNATRNTYIVHFYTNEILQHEWWEVEGEYGNFIDFDSEIGKTLIELAKTKIK